MTNSDLAQDYIKRARGRLRAVETLLEDALYADVVRESQEACELALKALIRSSGHSVPFSHEVSEKLKAIKTDLPAQIQPHVERLCQISKSLRRDRELSFYGSEDITPSKFYEKSHADQAINELKEVLVILKDL